jgi:hypothetical protein
MTANAVSKHNRSGEHFDQSAHVSPLFFLHFGTGLPQFHPASQKHPLEANCRVRVQEDALYL